MFSSCNPKLFAVKHIHYPVNPSSDNFHTDAVVPSSDHYRTETVLPPSEHYCIETVVPSGDHYCIDIAVPSSDHWCTETVPPSSDYHGTVNVAPSSDHLHNKITTQRKLFGEKNIHQKFGGHGPRTPPPLWLRHCETQSNCTPEPGHPPSKAQTLVAWKCPSHGRLENPHGPALQRAG